MNLLSQAWTITKGIDTDPMPTVMRMVSMPIVIYSLLILKLFEDTDVMRK